MIAIWVKNGCSQQLHIFETSEVSIGRAEENELAVPCGDVSRRHCKILACPTGFHILDLQSRNGTFVNGKRIQQLASIAANDEIKVGTITLYINNDLVVTNRSVTPRPGALPSTNSQHRTLIPVQDDGTGWLDSASLRLLIEQVLPRDPDFDAFCIDYFPSTKRQFGSDMCRTTKVNFLLESVERRALVALLIGRLNHKKNQ